MSLKTDTESDLTIQHAIADLVDATDALKKTPPDLGAAFYHIGGASLMIQKLIREKANDEAHEKTIA